MHKTLLNLLFFAALLCQVASLQARQPYHALVVINDESSRVSAPNLLDFRNHIEDALLALSKTVTTPLPAVALGINLRGIKSLASFAQNSTTLVVVNPQLGTTDTFTGATRNDSLTLFKDSIRDGGTNQRLLKAYPKFSPIDPIAGNPNSLMAQMGQADYLLGQLSPFSGCDCSWSAQPLPDYVQSGISYGRAFSRGFETTIVTSPLRYSYSPDLNWAFVIDAPFTYFRNGGASSLFGSVGFGLRIPITHEWALTPIVRAGTGGSLDLCTSGTFVSAGVTSIYNLKIKDFVVAMTNYAGYITSVNWWLSGVNFNYHLHNCVFKNGLSFTTCEWLTLLNKPINLRATFVDTYYAREHLFIRHYDEFGVALLTNYINPLLKYDLVSLGFTYQFGQKDYHGYFFNFLYQF